MSVVKFVVVGGLALAFILALLLLVPALLSARDYGAVCAGLLLIWLVLSIPVAIFVGKVIKLFQQ